MAIPVMMEELIMNGKRKVGIDVQYDETLGTISWNDSTGQNKAVVVNVDGLSEGIKKKALWHGVDQKVTDAGAMGMGHWDGKDKPQRYARVDERLARIRRVAENLIAGQWNVRQDADPLSGKSPAELEQLIKAAQGKLASLGIAASPLAEG